MTHHSPQHTLFLCIFISTSSTPAQRQLFMMTLVHDGTPNFGGFHLYWKFAMESEGSRERCDGTPGPNQQLGWGR
jgi:hypothetical protein